MDELTGLMHLMIALAERIHQREHLEAIEERFIALREKMELERMFALPDDRSN